MDSHTFCRELLRITRAEAKAAGVSIPKHLTAISSMNQFFVESRDSAGVYIEADCAYEAKAKFIGNLIEAAAQQSAKAGA